MNLRINFKINYQSVNYLMKMIKKFKKLKIQMTINNKIIINYLYKILNK